MRKATRVTPRLLAEENNLSERERIRMRDRELRGSPADLREASSGTAVQPQLRRTAWLADDFDVPPQHSLRVAGTESLHRRFFRREPAREMNCRIVVAHAVGDLRFREDTVCKPFAVAIDCCSDARDVCRVEAKSDDVHAPTA